MERVDVRGEVCPRPALIVRDRLADLEGDALLVEGDYQPAKGNLTRTCSKHGYEVEDRSAADDDGFELVIRPRETGADDD